LLSSDRKESESRKENPYFLIEGLRVVVSKKNGNIKSVYRGEELSH
jgi:hypothetical protein